QHSSVQSMSPVLVQAHHALLSVNFYDAKQRLRIFTMPTGSTTSHAVAVRPAAYGHGTILASAADEARKSTQGRRMIRERVMALGRTSTYTLPGLVRTFPLQPQDLEPLENQFTYYTHFLGRAEELALHYTGANPHTCSAVLCNRVSAAMLAIMLGTLKP